MSKTGKRLLSAAFALITTFGPACAGFFGTGFEKTSAPKARAAFAEASEPFYKNARFIETPAERADAKFNAKENFIYIVYGADCHNCSRLGELVFKKWTDDYGATLYGTEVTSEKPIFINDSYPDGIKLPLVCFIKNGERKDCEGCGENASEELDSAFFEFVGKSPDPADETGAAPSEKTARASALEYKIRDGEVNIIGCDKNFSGEMDIPAEIDGKPVKKIDDGAFKDCSRLSGVIIPDGVTRIGDRAFSDCVSLKKAELPKSAVEIGKGAFAGCKSLESVNIPDGVKIIDDDAFKNCASLKEATIPENATTIGYSAFYHCESLKSVNIPQDVETIGLEAFRGCANLGSFVVDADNVAYLSVDGALLNKRKTVLIQYPAGNARTSYTVPDGVKIIYERALDAGANLKSVTLPKSIEEIQTESFDGCGSLADVYYRGSENEWRNIAIGGGNGDLTSASIHYNYAAPPAGEEPGRTGARTASGKPTPKTGEKAVRRETAAHINAEEKTDKNENVASTAAEAFPLAAKRLRATPLAAKRLNAAPAAEAVLCARGGTSEEELRKAGWEIRLRSGLAISAAAVLLLMGAVASGALIRKKSV